MNITLRLFLGITLLITACITSVVCIVYSFWLLGLSAIFLLFYAIWMIIKGYNTQLRKVQVLFDAVENNDYSFRFPEHGLSKHEIELNHSFNGMRELLSRAKTEAVEREKYYELILGRVSTGIVVIDGEGYVYQTNDAALRLLNMSVLTHIKQLANIDESFPLIFKNTACEESRQISFTTERGERNLSLSVAELNGQDKSYKIISLNDIDSELDENEIESWVRLTRVLTHEIMNGISPITSLSELLLKKQHSKETQESLEVINHTACQLMDFVTTYRKFTRIPEPNKQIFDVKEFLNMEIIGMRATTALPIEFELNVEPEDLMLYADKNLISQIILNILKNAIHALETTPQPYIRLTARCNEKEHIIIDIDNNGEMIPPEVAKQIFVPFFTTKDCGSGIGLSVSKQIMRLHNGMIKLSYSTIKETRFTLTFR